MKTIAVWGLLLTFAGCGAQGNQTGVLLDGRAVVVGGTSFGMCAGYCVTELRIDSASITLTEDSHMAELPTRTRTLPLERSEWLSVQALVDTAALRRLEGVHGCPDCADGGAEWIEIEDGGQEVRVTFEYGAELDGIDELQRAIRDLRSRFPR